jgi:formylmethanofuran dehydrogenase subunit E
MGSGRLYGKKLIHDFYHSIGKNQPIVSPITMASHLYQISYEKPKWVLMARRRYLASIREAASRKTGFGVHTVTESDHDPSEETKTNDTSEHWVFGVEQRIIQGVNCETCGEYLMTSRFDFFIDVLPDRCVCRCDRVFPCG